MDDMIETPLSPIDHAAPRHYCAFRFYLPLKPGVTPESAYQVLHEGLHRTFTQLPWLSGQTWYQDPNAKGYRPGAARQLVFHQSDSGETFDELREEGFPTDALPDSLPEWISFPPDVGKGPDVFKAQATFIPGGCILLAGPQHLVCDGTAAISIINLIHPTLQLGGCLGGPGLPPPVSETEASHALPSPLTEVPMKSVIFYIPADRLTLLYKNSVDGGNSVLSGLDGMPRFKTPTTHPMSGSEGAWAAVAIMMDGRGQLDSDLLLSGYLGNMTCVNLALMPLAQLTSADTSLASIARLVREGAAGVNPKTLMDAYTLADALPDFNRLQSADMPLDGTALQISPLLSLPASDLDFGGQLFGNGGCPEALRPPMDWFNRSEEMDTLLQDPEFLEYAVYLAD
ncbi:hypothetical protein NM208_g8328 [Fusarium decemcellulare]|uniref:Uncharacterized protein n=1 Tax=Fusarium decemcellulare TaxID=57161 RepID=A0ACC1S5Q3_9HYPO|nr:hypothetical protein NM208_g8328 [Fusarium decemcellulare]